MDLFLILFYIVTPTEAYISNLKMYTCQFQNQINDFHERLNANISPDWKLETDPFAINFQPYEQISALRMLADTDNEDIQKIMKVFSALCFEVDDLERIVCINRPLSICSEIMYYYYYLLYIGQIKNVSTTVNL